MSSGPERSRSKETDQNVEIGRSAQSPFRADVATGLAAMFQSQPAGGSSTIPTTFGRKTHPMGSSYGLVVLLRLWRKCSFRQPTVSRQVSRFLRERYLPCVNPGHDRVQRLPPVAMTQATAPRRQSSSPNSTQMSGTAPTGALGVRETPIALQFSPNSLKLADGGFPVEVIFLQKGGGLRGAAMSILEGAQNVEEAQQPVDWTTSAEGQQQLDRTGPTSCRSAATLAPARVCRRLRVGEPRAAD